MHLRNNMSQMLLFLLNIALVPYASTLIIHPSTGKPFITRTQRQALRNAQYSKQHQQRKEGLSSTILYGIHEWRDTMIVPEEEDKILALKINDGTILPREICVLPFAYDEILLQGETKEIRLYEDRFIKLFQKSINEHGGIIGMALLVNDSSILKPIPICEIESYNQMSEFGIFCTLRVISRATIIRFVDYEPYITAICVERMDKSMDMGNKKQLDLLNYLASNIENTVLTLSSLEFQLGDGVKGKEEEGLGKSALYDRNYIDDDDEEDEELIDPVSRFRHAFHQAKESDFNGYTTTIQPTTTPERSLQDLTAISWAAFCCDDPQKDNNMTYRIQVLDSSRLLDRLYMGIYVLREKKKELEEELKLVRKKQQRENEDIL